MSVTSKPKRISAERHLQARGLAALFTLHYRQARAAEEALSKLLGYKETYCGSLSDELYEPKPDFDEGMKLEGFYIAKKKPR